MRLLYRLALALLISLTTIQARTEPFHDENQAFLPLFFSVGPLLNAFYAPDPQLMLMAEPLAVPGIAPFGPPPLIPNKIMRNPGPPWQLDRKFFNPWTWDRFLWPARGLNGLPYNMPVPPEFLGSNEAP